MSYCFNPACPQPQNQVNNVCSNCGNNLKLKDRYYATEAIEGNGFGQSYSKL